MIAPLIPKWPRPGQALALAAPSGTFARERLEAGLAVLSRLAPAAELRVDEVIFEQDGYLAGADQKRARHLSDLMSDPTVGAVLCVRGGFGASRLLPLLDFKALAAGRRLLLGFSDITCLLNALAGQGLVTFHGPVVTQLPNLEEASQQELASLLTGRPPWPAGLQGNTLAAGRAQGPLLGGNLTMLCHLLGTPFMPPLTGAILFLEETNEAPYRLDRLLTQLDLAGVFAQVAGVALGSLSENNDAVSPLEEVAARRLAHLGKPVVYGLPFGHGRVNRLLPVGARAELDGEAGLLTVGVGLV